MKRKYCACHIHTIHFLGGETCNYCKNVPTFTVGIYLEWLRTKHVLQNCSRTTWSDVFQQDITGFGRAHGKVKGLRYLLRKKQFFPIFDLKQQRNARRTQNAFRKEAEECFSGTAANIILEIMANCQTETPRKAKTQWRLTGSGLTWWTPCRPAEDRTPQIVWRCEQRCYMGKLWRVTSHSYVFFLLLLLLEILQAD